MKPWISWCAVPGSRLCHSYNDPYTLYTDIHVHIYIILSTHPNDDLSGIPSQQQSRLTKPSGLTGMALGSDLATIQSISISTSMSRPASISTCTYQQGRLYLSLSLRSEEEAWGQMPLAADRLLTHSLTAGPRVSSPCCRLHASRQPDLPAQDAPVDRGPTDHINTRI